jgi:DNA adenine methylase
MTLENAQPVAPVQCVVTRPAFRYYGGKWKLAPWIISKFPRHQHYVEPCGGAASVLLQKPLSPIETYNDLNGDVVKFFRVLRTRPEELCHAIRWTPWARAEIDATRTDEVPADDLECARRWWVYHMMSVNAAPGHMREGGWDQFRRDSQHIRNTIDNRAREDMIRNLFAVAERLRQTQIESRPMNQLMMELDGRGTLFYVDPPYVSETRSHGSGMYGVEWVDSDHSEFIEIVQNLQGFCVISGYACELYEPLERAGWQREDKVAVNNSGDKRTESLWLCPRTVEASSGMLF